MPVGDYARQSLKNMEADAAYGAGFSDSVLKNLVSEEPNVKSVVSKLQLGEADAGIVYRTDITAGVAKDVSAVEIPDAVQRDRLVPDRRHVEGWETGHRRRVRRLHPVG